MFDPRGKFPAPLASLIIVTDRPMERTVASPSDNVELMLMSDIQYIALISF